MCLVTTKEIFSGQAWGEICFDISTAYCLLACYDLIKNQHDPASAMGDTCTSSFHTAELVGCLPSQTTHALQLLAAIVISIIVHAYSKRNDESRYVLL